MRVGIATGSRGQNESNNQLDSSLRWNDEAGVALALCLGPNGHWGHSDPLALLQCVFCRRVALVLGAVGKRNF